MDSITQKKKMKSSILLKFARLLILLIEKTKNSKASKVLVSKNFNL